MKILEGECDLTDDIAPEYDLANMKIDWEQTEKLRAYARLQRIKIDSDLLDFFKTPEAINEALRALMRLVEQAKEMKDAA
ncbi:MAG: hypothetical protein J2P21_20780 [Chloracidobacterium sp.]|nr:hypothetical protein [Chloracidobacterium sp.]